MSTGTRSTRGCWTCRIRKKKCDERTPECSSCEALQITCHAYHQKPEWMDGGGKEKEAAKKIKLAVKESLRQKVVLRRSLRKHSRVGRPRVSLKETSTQSEEQEIGASSSSTLSASNNDCEEPPNNQLFTPGVFSSTPSFLNRISQVPESDSSSIDLSEIIEVNGSAAHDLVQSNISTHDDSAISESYGSHEDHRARLLMHFFDHVFPLEFPFYDPSIFDGGRGWLLSLLLRTKPLYHAVLSISGYHHSALIRAKHNTCRYQTWNELQKHHTLALQELHQDMEELCSSKKDSLDGGVDALASIVQMISFELFVGGTDIWKTHLHAATALFSSLISNANISKHVWDTIVIPTSRQYSPNDSIPYSANKSAFRFLCAVLMWYDIFSCISTGSKPALQEYHDHLLAGDDPFLKLEEVMGCKSEVMILIAKVAALNAWKKESKALGKLSMLQLASRATRIEDDLKLVLVKIASDDSQPVHSFANSSGIKEVTQVFASSALIYLHVIVSGVQPELPEIQENVARTITMLENLSDPRWLRSLVWPLCITGCMASREQESFFRNLVSGMGVESYVFGSARNALKIMENCWEKRDTKSDILDWETCMNSLDHLILIV